MSDSATAATVTVYTRENCHLCTDALATVREVAASVPGSIEISEVDIDTDPELAAAYGERVPYVLVDGQPQFKYRVDETELRQRLTEERTQQ
jgi:glutaredoxin